MDWESPRLLLLILPALAFLLWAEGRSAHPMSALRRRLLFIVRALGVILALAALAGPARIVTSARRAVVIALDHSESMGAEGIKAAVAGARAARESLPAGTEVFYEGFGDGARLLNASDLEDQELATLRAAQKQHGGQSDYESAVELARALFPAGTSRHILLVGDGHETRGSLAHAARAAAASGVRIHALPVAGPRKPDVRVRQVTPSQSRIHEGAALTLAVDVESTLDGAGLLKLFENGIEVEQRRVTVRSGEAAREVFTRHPGARNVYSYRAVLEGFPGDTIPSNNEGLTLVDVRGRLRLLYVEGEPAEGRYLMQAMEKEGIVLELRQPGSIPATAQDLAGYDGVILSDVPAHRVGERAMAAIRDYVEKLGGGLVMIGGPNSFGVGGYYRTPIEEALPVRLKGPDEEERQSSALAICIDRSGSMAGEKLEMAKSASIATAEVLTRSDYIGVWAFDSESHGIVPMTRLTSTAAVAGQIAGLSAGGGTNLYPAMTDARNALQRVKAKIKHMLILTDGETAGSGYEALASQCRSEGITISTVGIGQDVRLPFLQAIASLAGGQSYSTMDASAITRIFTQDTLMHTGRMIREEPFEPVLAERHPILAGWERFDPPPLLGYVKTTRKSLAQVPLLADGGDPLLAHWRFGLGKVTAFTSDAKSRWASLWISRWNGFGQFWSQLLRETARPPQGRNLDLRCDLEGGQARVTVDAMEDAGARANNERVTAEVFFAPAGAPGSELKFIQSLALRQSGPGLYEATFKPAASGVYLVRAQSGAQMVTAGVVHQPGAESSLGTVQEKLLREACTLTGGTYLAGDARLDLGGAKAKRYLELWPALVTALMLLFLLDIAIRRWEHVTGLFDWIRPRSAVRDS